MNKQLSTKFSSGPRDLRGEKESLGGTADRTPGFMQTRLSTWSPKVVIDVRSIHSTTELHPPDRTDVVVTNMR